MKTAYSFSSQDGYPFSYLEPNSPGMPPPMTPYPHSNEAGAWSDQVRDYFSTCSIKYDACFVGEGEAFDRASEVFVNIAFEKVECGDCIIRALIAASGHLGLSAFLPESDRRLPSLKWDHPSSSSSSSPPSSVGPPHLPLVSNFHDGDFSLRRVVGPWAETSASEGGVSVREWTLQLLQRYRFVVGETPWKFSVLYNEGDARRTVAEVERDKSLALLCINDDVEKGEQVDSILIRWLRKRWPTAASWEAW